jgi:AcrR family transcriptional regulator
MARYGKDHRARTKQRILDAAGVRLKTDGIDGSGVAALMADAGLTNGAFYSHFPSKEDLVAQTVSAQLMAQRESLVAAVRKDGLRSVVTEYLSRAHCADAGHGCPSAALLDEIARSGPAVKDAYTAGLVGLVDDISAALRPDDPSAVRTRVLSAVAAMVGALQLARALTDPRLAEELLAETGRAVLAQLNSET